MSWLSNRNLEFLCAFMICLDLTVWSNPLCDSLRCKFWAPSASNIIGILYFLLAESLMVRGLKPNCILEGRPTVLDNSKPEDSASLGFGPRENGLASLISPCALELLLFFADLRGLIGESKFDAESNWLVIRLVCESNVLLFSLLSVLSKLTIFWPRSGLWFFRSSLDCKSLIFYVMRLLLV